MNPKILIADDEPHLQAHLRRLLDRVWPESEIVATTSNGGDTQSALREHPIDVAFLDIRMPPPSGLEIAETLVGSSTQVVFVTAYDEYAVAAFEKNACDYLQKPVSEQRLAATVERLKHRIANDQTANVVASIQADIEALKHSSQTKHIPVSHRGVTKVVALRDILYFKSDAKYTLATDTHHDYLLASTLKELESKLDENEFWRIHRNCIVNVHHIDEVTESRTNQMSVSMVGRKELLRVSRPYRYRFREF